MPAELVNNCYLIIDDVNAGATNQQSIKFQSMPDDLQSTKTANINEIQILGRSEPIKTYGSSGPRSWNLELHFFNNDGDSVNEVVRWTNWLESLAYPIYLNGISYGLPRLIFAFGNILQVRVICSSVTTTWNSPWDMDGTMTDTQFLTNVIGPMHASSQIVLDQISRIPFGHNEVFNGVHNRPS